jgi:hypothetical protein
MSSDFNIEKGNALVAAMDPAELKAAMADWSKFVRLPWDAQKAIEHASPEAVRQIKDRFYNRFGPLGVGR